MSLTKALCDATVFLVWFHPERMLLTLRRRRIALAAACGSLLIQTPALAASFSDVQSTHPAYNAVMFLADNGMVKGYADGTFKPDAPVDRAAAVKMILGGLVSEEEANAAAASAPSYKDMPKDAWYRGWVAKGVALGFIDGPDKRPAFEGSRQVNLAELLKMLLIAHQMDQNSYSEMKLPLALDVQDATAWLYPYLRLGIATSVVMVDSAGNLNPGKTLTRGDVATDVYRLLMYLNNRRAQALLTLTETELSNNVLSNLTPEGLQHAKMAYARAFLAVRGALTRRPDESIVKGAVKVTEGFGALISAYEAGVGGRLDDVLFATGEAWTSAEKAKEFSPGLAEIAANMQTIAHNMAEEARKLKEQP